MDNNMIGKWNRLDYVKYDDERYIIYEERPEGVILVGDTNNKYTIISVDEVNNLEPYPLSPEEFRVRLDYQEFIEYGMRATEDNIFKKAYLSKAQGDDNE